MRVLLIGGSGFIGRNFIVQSPKDYQIFAIYRSSPDFEHFAANFSNLSILQCNLWDSLQAKERLSVLPDYFDAAVFVWGNSNIDYSYKEPLLDLNYNLVSLINLISHLHFKKFIFMSSGTVYMGQKGLVDDKKFLNPGTPYGISKLASELYIRFFAEKTKQIEKYVIIRFFGAYGPIESPRKIFTNLIKRLCIEKKTDFTLTGDGSNLIDAMYIDDTIKALNKIILSETGNVTVDLCKGEPLTLNELVTKVASIFDVKDFALKHVGESKEFITFYASPKKADELFGFRATTSLEEGMKKLKNYLLGEKIYV
jgi:nucleoside-diphosphate-sugar epimerase